jgi:hypothetical protein
LEVSPVLEVNPVLEERTEVVDQEWGPRIQRNSSSLVPDSALPDVVGVAIVGY